MIKYWLKILTTILVGAINIVSFAGSLKVDLDDYKDHPRLQLLIKNFKNSDNEDNEYAWMALAHLGNKRAIPSIIALLGKRSPNDDLTQYILVVLAKLHDDLANDAIIDFVKRNRKKLNSENLDFLLNTIKFINKKDQKRVLDLLIQDKLDGKNIDFMLCNSMLCALERVPDKKYKNYLLNLLKNNKFNKSDAADTLVEYFNKDELWEMRNDKNLKRDLRISAIFALAILADQRVKQIIIDFIDKLKEYEKKYDEKKYNDAMTEVKRALFPFYYGYGLLSYYAGDKEVSDYLIRDLSSDIYYSILALGEVGGKDAIDALKKHFQKSEYKKAILEALTDLGEDKFVANGYKVLASELIETIKDKTDSKFEVARDANKAYHDLYELCKNGVYIPNLTSYILNTNNNYKWRSMKDDLFLCMTYSKAKLDKKLMTMLWGDFRKGVMKERFSKLAIASLLLHHSNSIETTQILKKFDGEDLSEKPGDRLYEFARALALHKGKLVDKILIHLLRDSEKNSVRAQAAKSLSGRKSKAVRKALEYAEKYEAYPNVRKAVKKALERINDEQNQKSEPAVKAK